jgi:hypothetical protein
MVLEGEQIKTKTHNIHAEKVLRPITGEQSFQIFAERLSVRGRSEA